MDTRHALSYALTAAEGPDDFFMFRYKILTCPRRHSHDWTSCPFAHSGESARRRDPSVYRPIPCPESKTGRPCPRGESCKYAHNDFEYWLHPTRYCTEYCKQGPGCKRRVCFFAHKPCELRKPADIINTLNAYGWLASTDGSGQHGRRESLSSMDSSESVFRSGACYQLRGSFGSIESLTGEATSPGSYGSDLSLLSSAGTLTSGRSPRLRQAHSGGFADVPIMANVFPQQAPLNSVPATDANVGFATGAYPAQQVVFDEVKNALAGCCADSSILESVDPSIFLAGSPALSPNRSKPGAVGNYGSNQRPQNEENQNEKVAACLKMPVGELRKRCSTDAGTQQSCATGGGSGVKESSLDRNAQVLSSVPSPKTKTLDEVLTGTLATGSCASQGGFEAEYSGGFRPVVPPFLLESPIKSVTNIGTGRRQDGFVHSAGVPREGQCGVPEVGQPINGTDNITTTNKIIASLAMNLEDSRKEENDLNSMLGAMQFGGHAATNYGPTAPAGPTLLEQPSPQDKAMPGRHRFLDAVQLNAMSWELAKSLNFASGRTSHSTGVSAADVLALHLRSLASSAQEQVPLRGSRLSVECGALGDLAFGIPEGLPLCG